MTMLDDATLAEARARTAAVAPDAIAPDDPAILTAPFPEATSATDADVAAPPSETSPAVPGLRLARERRSAFRSAMAGLRTRGHADDGPIRTALANADRDGIITAVVQHALGLFLDQECGRPYTLLHELSAGVENGLVAAIYAAQPGQILETVPEDGTPEVAYIRQHAVAATTMDDHLFDFRGQATAPKVPTLSMMQTMVPR